MVERRNGEHRDKRSNIEVAFGIENLTLREYMTRGPVYNLPPHYFLNIAEQLSQNDHPLIRYAGGWAAAESAFFPYPHFISKSGTEYHFSLEDRMDALDKAVSIWKGAIPLFDQASTEAETSYRRAQFSAYKMRAERDIAYLPSFQLAAAWFGGYDTHTIDTQKIVATTTQQVMSCAGEIVNTEGKGSDFYRTRSGVIKELTAALLLQNDDPPRYLITPTSFRLDHHDFPGWRADLVSISTEPHHARTLIQVSSTLEETPADHERFLIRAEDLILPSRGTALGTLRAITNTGRAPTTWEERAEINARSQEILGQLDNFNAAA